MLNAVKAGLEIREVPSLELERRAGKSNLNAFRDGRRVLATMLRERPANARAEAAGAPMDLLRVEVAALESDAWMPAGKDSTATARPSARMWQSSVPRNGTLRVGSGSSPTRKMELVRATAAERHLVRAGRAVR